MSGVDLGVSTFPDGESIFFVHGLVQLKLKKEFCMRVYLINSLYVFH